MRNRKKRRVGILCATAIALLGVSNVRIAVAENAKSNSSDRFLSLPIAKMDAAGPRMMYRYGVPFMERSWHAPPDGILQVKVGVAVTRIFLLGIRETQRPHGWSNPSR